ncbi:hypothetical protein [Halostagnicola bangensis]
MTSSRDDGFVGVLSKQGVVRDRPAQIGDIALAVDLASIEGDIAVPDHPIRPTDDERGDDDTERLEQFDRVVLAVEDRKSPSPSRASRRVV